MRLASNPVARQSERLCAEKRSPVCLVAVVVLAALTVVSCRQAVEATGADRPALVGRTAPDFALTDLSGKTVRLADFKGKVVLLDFWATWCAPCREEIPDFVELQEQYAEQGFTLLGISLDEEGAEVVKPFAQQLGINYPVVIGNTEVSAAYGGMQALPTAFLIGRDGRILEAFVGDRARPDFERAIRSALRRDRTAPKPEP
jgi:cytochrome c biogenesis protein CcmG/thiol:disulfide interchange protein DsbE